MLFTSSAPLSIEGRIEVHLNTLFTVRYIPTQWCITFAPLVRLDQNRLSNSLVYTWIDPIEEEKKVHYATQGSKGLRIRPLYSFKKKKIYIRCARGCMRVYMYHYSLL